MFAGKKVIREGRRRGAPLPMRLGYLRTNATERCANMIGD